jgi:hypothetical protein
MHHPEPEQRELDPKRYKELCEDHGINPMFANRMWRLQGYHIIIICDDSGSMNSPSNPTVSREDPYDPPKTRWDELKQTVGLIIDIATCVNQDGVDVYFLNREGKENVTHKNDLEDIFSKVPTKYNLTPIVPKLREVLSKNNSDYSKRLIILATDGEPTNTEGNATEEEKNKFETLLKKGRRIQDFVTIAACTDNEETMSYLNDWDVKIPRLDVVDDYGSEYKEIIRARGKKFQFNRGDYVVKLLMGSIDPYFDKLDEKNFCILF